ncbi:MAG: DUF2029 domain-containing protein [Chloroflexota bacterium]|nr:MAG: DUF2029 domain-containing protein [Chloroflexota bacterium]
MAMKPSSHRMSTLTAEETFGLQHESAGRIDRLRLDSGAWISTNRDFVLLLILFFTFRLMSLAFTSQEGYLSDSRAHDFWFYRDFAELSLHGYYPFVQYWLEYPPLFAWVVIGIYNLSLLIPAFRDSLFPFYFALGGFLLLAETGSFVLIYLIASRLHGPTGGMRVAYMYAGLFLPVYVLVGWFDSLPLFFMLLALYALIRERPVLSAAAVGIGFMTKIIPGILVVVAVRSFARWRYRLLYPLVAATTAGLIALPFIFLNARMLWASFHATMARSSWETIWAVLENYYEFGAVAPLAERFWPESAEWQSHPPTLPWFWINLAFAISFLIIYALRLNWRGPKALVASTAFAVSFLFIASKGYSPQFVVYWLPFVFFLLPSAWGLVLALIYSAANLLEYPVYALVFPEEHWVLWLTTIVRTTLFVVLAVEALGQLSDPLDALLTRIKRRALRPATIGLVLVLVITGGALAQRFFERSEFFLLSHFIKPISAPGQATVVSTRELFYYVHPYLRGFSDFYVVDDDWASRQDEVVDQLEQFLRDRPQVWLVMEPYRPDDGRNGFLQQLLRRQGTESTNRLFDRFQLVGFVPPEKAIPLGKAWKTIGADFADQLRLESYQASADSVMPGQPIRLALRWRALQQMPQDYTVFVHLRNQAYSIWGQQDKLLTNVATPTSKWKSGDTVDDIYDLLVLPGTPPGRYQLSVGVYVLKTGKRLPVAAGPKDGPDWVTFQDITIEKGPYVGELRFQHQRALNFDNRIRLLGYEVNQWLMPGETVNATLFWRSSQRIPEDYVISMQLLDRDKRVITSVEGQPADGTYPTSRWSRGEIVRDQYHLLVGNDTPPGDYQVIFRVLDGPDGSPLGLIGNTTAQFDGWASMGWVRILDRSESETTTR